MKDILDFKKISFNELGDTDTPLQAFYNYDLQGNEIETFLRTYASTEEVPEGVSIQKIELCLTFYSKHDFKLEACCMDTDNNPHWVEMIKQFTNAGKFISLMPNNIKTQIAGWIKTDDLQWRRKINDTAYQLIEVRKVFCNEYVFVFKTINTEDYGEEDILSCIESFGYESMKTIKELYKEDANGILAECLFECISTSELVVSDAFKTEDEAERAAEEYIATLK